MNSFKEELQDLSDFVRRFAFWRTLLMIQIGCFMFGLVVSGILIPQNFFAGGLMGISLLIRTLSGDWISLSLLYILLNLPRISSARSSRPIYIPASISRW